MATNGNISIYLAAAVPAFGLVFSIIFGIWTLEQSQVTDVKEQIYQIRLDRDRADGVLRDELSKRSAELKLDLGDINHQLDARRAQFTEEREFSEFRQRLLGDVENLKAQIIVLEQTRPTTGELQAIEAALKERVDQIERSPAAGAR